MSPLKKYFIILSIIFILVLLFIKVSPQKYTDKKMDFSPMNKNPYGFYILNQEIDNFFTKKVKKTSYLNLEEENDSIYNIISNQNQNIFLEELENYKNYYFYFYHYYAHYTNFLGSKIIQNEKNISYFLTADNAKDIKVIIKEEISHAYFTNLNFPNIKVLGYFVYKNKKYPNFIEISTKKSKYYITTAKLPFTNLYLKEDKQARRYTEKVFAYLPADRPTIWKNGNFPDEENETEYGENSLSFILKNKQLAWGWRILLFTFILYIVFEGKRRQRIIPVIEKLKNTSVEFIQTIGTLHFQEENHSKLIDKKITYFLENIRQKYLINTDTIDNNFTKLLSKKANKSEENIKNIVLFITNFNKNKKSSENDFILLNSLIEKFWNENN